MRHGLVLAIAFAGLACSKDKDKPRDTREELGEAIGAQVPGAGKVPSMSVALAVSKGKDPVPLLAPFVDAVTKATVACPAFASEMLGRPSDPAGLELAIEGGKLHVTGHPEPTPPMQCFVGALEGKVVLPPETPRLGARTEILVQRPDAEAP